MDGRSAYRIQQRGLGDLLGVSIAQFPDRDYMERLSDDAINGKYQHRVARFRTRGEANYVIKPKLGDVRAVGYYEDRKGNQRGISGASASNAAGGRIAVFGRSPWEIVISEALHRRFLAVADWVCGGNLPVLLETAAQVVIVPRITTHGELRSVFLLNVSIDRTRPLELRLRGIEGTAAHWNAPDGASTELTLTSTGEDFTVLVPELDPWSAGLLVTCGKTHR